MSTKAENTLHVTGDPGDDGPVRHLARLLSAHPGRWSLVTTAPDLLVLEREDATPAIRTVLAGRITRGGHLLDVISCISTSRWTGRLCVRSAEVTRTLTFDQGALRMASSSEASDRLGELLHRMGKISREQLDDAVRAMGPGRRIGEILIEQGVTTTRDVFETIHRQVEDQFYAVIEMSGGTFFFEEGIDRSGMPMYVSLDTNNLLMEGVRRSDELRHFRKLVPGMRIVLGRKPRSFPPMAPDASADDVGAEFLARCDGHRTLEQVAGSLGLGEYDATRLAYVHLTSGALEVIPTESAGEESIRFVVDRFNDMIGVVNQAIHVHSDPERFLSDVHSYTSQGGEFEDFISDLELDATGHLDIDNVTTVLWRTRVRDRMSYLVQVLSQYLFYILFLAEARLPRETHARVSEEVHTMLQKIGA